MRRRLVLVTLILASLTTEPARSQSTVPAADSQIAPASSDDREAPPAAAARPDEYLHPDLSPTEQADAISQLNELRGAVRVTPDSAEDRLRLAQALYRFGDLSEGWFREDLYFRLTGLVFRLPPLRERPDDIPLLTDAFLSDIAAQMGKPVPQLSHEALRALVEQEWKGNVRELRHCLEQAVTLNDGPILSKDSLRLTVDHAKLSGRAKHLLPAPAGDAAVLNCLRQHGFDMQATAKTLGWDRSTITQRLKGLCFQSLLESDGDQAKAALTIAGDPSHLRTVELKLMDYYSHLLSVIEPFATADEALADCKRRFKNLPDRHFAAVERLVRKHFEA